MLISRKVIRCLLYIAALSSQSTFAEDILKVEVETEAPLPAASQSVSSKLTLDDALAKALLQSPHLQAFGSALSAAKNERRQAGVLQNPEISVEMDNIEGDGPYKRFDSAEVTYSISQLIEIGGKISSRKKIAGKSLEIVDLESQAAALDLVRDVTIAYADAVASEENVRLASEQKILAEDVFKSVSLRVDAAAAPLIQKSRAEVEQSTMIIALDSAVRQREIARKNLAVLLGEEQLISMLDNTTFYSINKVLTEKKTKNPDVLKLKITLDRSMERLALEKANAIPDLRFTLGTRNFKESGYQAFIMGVSLPIPVLNTNRGNIEKARSEINKTERDNQHALLLLNAALSQAQQEMDSAYLQAEILRTQILPAAEKAFELAQEGYTLGRFPYLEVLDAQRSLFGVKQQHIVVLQSFHRARATVERLVAAHAHRIKETGEFHVQ